MPASGFLFAQSVVFLMVVFTLVIGAAARLFGRSATPLMVPVAIVFAISIPFLFAWRPAGAPNYRDALLGWPLSYAESDSGLAGFRLVPLLTDLALGTVAGAIYLFIRRRRASQRIAEPGAPDEPPTRL